MKNKFSYSSVEDVYIKQNSKIKDGLSVVVFTVLGGVLSYVGYMLGWGLWGILIGGLGWVLLLGVFGGGAEAFKTCYTVYVVADGKRHAVMNSFNRWECENEMTRILRERLHESSL